MRKERGIRRTVWLPEKVDVKAEETREKLGLGRSAFYRFAVVETIRNSPQKEIC